MATKAVAKRGKEPSPTVRKKAEARFRAKFGKLGIRPRGISGAGYQNYSVVGQAAPDSAGAESVVAFNADCVSFMKNDGAVDVLVAFDTPAGAASVTRKPITLKAGETMTNISTRTANVALKSTGVPSAVRIVGQY